jgi:two-component system NtrC family sensor kinase
MNSESGNYQQAWQREKEARRRAEQLLEDRARELYRANQQLQRNNELLEANQQQLIQNEKMASLGVLAAGMAHEINNPVGYSLSNLSVLKDYVVNLKQFLKLLEDAGSLPSEIQAHIDADEFRTIIEDAQSLTDETIEGLESVKKIVADLQGFSRSDQNAFSLADVNEGIKSTINVLSNQIKYSADVELDLQPLPKIECDIAKLNQVFLNIILNAVQCTPEHVQIYIRSRLADHQIIIEVEDNGAGIPQNIIGSLFDPFFTTKSVGEGTGLGLAISHRIVVEDHGGSIEVESEEGVGTTFFISIPIAARGA